jgi:ATP-grasp ribosomal peptide maturase
MIAAAVLVIAGRADSTADLVTESIHRRGVQVFRFDTADFPQRLGLDAELYADTWRGWLRGKNGEIELERVSAVYLRRPDPFDPPPHLTEVERWHAAMESRYGLGGVLTTLQVRWCNHPGRSADATYKPRQLAELSAGGLRTPPTLITTSAARVREFAERVGTLVCKPIAVSVLHAAAGAQVVYTRLLRTPDLDDLGGIDYAPHLFQAFVPKAFEVRLIVVGEQSFAVRIDAGSERARIDWRSDYSSLRYGTIEVPAAVRSGVNIYMKNSGLGSGVFDFVVTPAGEWVALECNPDGQWEWLAFETGLPIADAIAGYLTEGIGGR